MRCVKYKTLFNYNHKSTLELAIMHERLKGMVKSTFDDYILLINKSNMSSWERDIARSYNLMAYELMYITTLIESRLNKDYDDETRDIKTVKVDYI